MKCPFGQEVGEPPLVACCPLGFPGCSCGDELVLAVIAPDDQSGAVLTWWQQHGSEF